MEGQFDMVLWFLAVLAAGGLTAAFWTKKKQIAYLSAVRRELKKEKQWLRRGEYNAAMVKGRQNLELLLKCVAENQGIQIDNSALAIANQRAEQYAGGKNNGGTGKNNRSSGQNSGGQNMRPWKSRRGAPSTMTNQQFCRWLAEKGYLDRVARWELNEIRLIGNRAVHENYDAKDEAWNQYNYLEDILKIFMNAHQPLGERRRGRQRDFGKLGISESAGGSKKQSLPVNAGSGKKLVNQGNTGNRGTQKNPVKTGSGRTQKNPVKTENSKMQKNPVKTESSKTQKIPMNNGNSGTQKNPVDAGNSGKQKNPCDTGNGGKQKKPADAVNNGKQKKPADAVNNGKQKNPVDAGNSGKQKKPVDAVINGKQKKPVDAGNNRKQRSQSISGIRINTLPQGIPGSRAVPGKQGNLGNDGKGRKKG